MEFATESCRTLMESKGKEGAMEGIACCERPRNDASCSSRSDPGLDFEYLNTETKKSLELLQVFLKVSKSGRTKKVLKQKLKVRKVPE